MLNRLKDRKFELKPINFNIKQKIRQELTTTNTKKNHNSNSKDFTDLFISFCKCNKLNKYIKINTEVPPIKIKKKLAHYKKLASLPETLGSLKQILTPYLKKDNDHLKERKHSNDISLLIKGINKSPVSYKDGTSIPRIDGTITIKNKLTSQRYHRVRNKHVGHIGNRVSLITSVEGKPSCKLDNREFRMCLNSIESSKAATGRNSKEDNMKSIKSYKKVSSFKLINFAKIFERERLLKDIEKNVNMKLDEQIALVPILEVFSRFKLSIRDVYFSAPIPYS